MENNKQLQTNVKTSKTSIPTFTPPAPTFTPPANMKPNFDGPACYYHEDERAVAKCARCGRFICQDCFDNYGVIDGEYKDKALCYDCCQQIVAENVVELKKNKNKILFHFIVSIIGMIAGLIVGIACGGGFIGAVIGIAVGGVLLSAIKLFFSMVGEVVSIAASGQFGVITFLSIILNIFVAIIRCLIATITNTIYYISYLIKTSNFIKNDELSLQQMADYMEYTMIRNQNRGVDIETLLKQKSELADNSYAQIVKEKGEEAAEIIMRDCVATINENGEIIRSFNIIGKAA